MFRKIRQHTLATSYLFYVVLHAIICAEIWLRVQSPVSVATSPVASPSHCTATMPRGPRPSKDKAQADGASSSWTSNWYDCGNSEAGRIETRSVVQDPV